MIPHSSNEVQRAGLEQPAAIRCRGEAAGRSAGQCRSGALLIPPTHCRRPAPTLPQGTWVHGTAVEVNKELFSVMELKRLSGRLQIMLREKKRGGDVFLIGGR